MKIIATADSTVILEATTNEVNALDGNNLYEYNNYRGCWDKCPRPGVVFNVVEGISQLHRNAKRAEEVQRLKIQLQSIILQLDLVEPFMKEPDPVAIEKESEK